MNGRQRNRMIRAAAMAIVLGGGAVLAWVIATPVRVETNESSPAERGGSVEPAIAAAAAQTVAPRRLTLEELREVCGLDLRRPLSEVPPATGDAAVAPPPVAITVRLVGTAQEHGHSVAMFQKQDGTLEVCAQGQSIEDGGVSIRVMLVEAARVMVNVAGVMCELSMPPVEEGVVP